MTGGGEHIQLCLAATGIGTPLDGLHQIVIDTNGDGVSIRVIIAEERRVVAYILALFLLAFPVLGNGSEHLVHRVFALFEDVLLQGGEAVGNGAKARTLDIGRVITGTTAIVVLTLLDAVVDIKTQEGGWRIEREHTLDIVVYREFQVHEVGHLLVPGLVKLLEGPELAGIARLYSELLACLRVYAVVQRDFQDFRRVQIARQQIGLLSEGSHLDAA